jgi:hypothetical protein
MILFSCDAMSTMTDPFQPHWDLYPKSYVVSKVPQHYSLLENINGDLTKNVWQDVPFSDAFDDIRGVHDAPSEDRPSPDEETRFKALYDDTHLYVGAILRSDFTTEAHFTERNSPIFQKDSDFEVFVDLLGSNHGYKELEVNALNTVWNLMLDKPYDDGGVEHSGRIARQGDPLYYDVRFQKTATRLLHGDLNDPNRPATWSVEVALSWKDLQQSNDDDDDDGSLRNAMVRVNFSRVERRGRLNWTWQPQVVWNPRRRRHEGRVAMHLPDAWGYFLLSDGRDDEEGPLDVERDPSWPGRVAAMNVYYSQAAYHDEHGTYATTMEGLVDHTDDRIVAPFSIRLDGNGGGYTATIVGNPDGSVVTVREDRYLRVSLGTRGGDDVEGRSQQQLQ